MLNTFEETFEVTEMRTFKHEPFFIVGAEEGSLFVVLYGNTENADIEFIIFRQKSAVIGAVLLTFPPQLYHFVYLNLPLFFFLPLKNT